MVDAARTVLRLGHEPVIVYRRDHKNMTALPCEADEALEEGVRVHWLRSIAVEQVRRWRALARANYLRILNSWR